jgi:hypothetical protein
VREEDRDRAMSRQAVELDVWEDEGGTAAGHVPEFPSRHTGRKLDESRANSVFWRTSPCPRRNTDKQPLAGRLR